MRGLVIKEYMCAERLQHILLSDSSQKEHLVNTHIPRPERADNTHVSRRASGRNKRSSDRAVFLRVIFLQL